MTLMNSIPFRFFLKHNKTKQNKTTVLTAYGLKGGFGAWASILNGGLRKFLAILGKWLENDLFWLANVFSTELHPLWCFDSLWNLKIQPGQNVWSSLSSRIGFNSGWTIERGYFESKDQN